MDKSIKLFIYFYECSPKMEKMIKKLNIGTMHLIDTSQLLYSATSERFTNKAVWEVSYVRDHMDCLSSEHIQLPRH